MTPDEFTIQEFMLDVGNGHKLYIHEWGNKKVRTPIIFLHGGPGGGVSDKYKTTFDPRVQRVIFYDQRGCGRSIPLGSLEHNTTQDAIKDIERIAIHMKLTKFILTGGSWGSCLALAYALQYPKRVKAMVLRGIFTGSVSEIEWLDKGWFQHFYPDAWEKYLAQTPAKYRNDPSKYHFSRALESDPDSIPAKESAYIYENLERAILSLDDRFTPEDYENYDFRAIRIEMYYMANKCFLEDRYILDNAHTLKMPVWLIQGRYDMVCPPVTAYELSQKLPNCELVWTIAGHGNDRPNYDVNRTILLQMAKGD